MPMAGNKMCSLFAISGMPSRVTSLPPFPAGRGSRPPSPALVTESDDPGVELPASVPSPSTTACSMPLASLERPGRNNGLVSVASWPCRPLSTAILNTERDHGPKELPGYDEERGGIAASTTSLSPAISSSGLCAGTCRGRPIAGTPNVSGPHRPPAYHCRHRCRAHTCR